MKLEEACDESASSGSSEVFERYLDFCRRAEGAIDYSIVGVWTLWIVACMVIVVPAFLFGAVGLTIGVLLLTPVGKIASYIVKKVED
jgi:hypothetical protein